jgi:hypothetical protein
MSLINETNEDRQPGERLDLPSFRYASNPAVDEQLQESLGADAFTTAPVAPANPAIEYNPTAELVDPNSLIQAPNPDDFAAYRGVIESTEDAAAEQLSIEAQRMEGLLNPTLAGPIDGYQFGVPNYDEINPPAGTGGIMDSSKIGAVDALGLRTAARDAAGANLNLDPTQPAQRRFNQSRGVDNSPASLMDVLGAGIGTVYVLGRGIGNLINEGIGNVVDAVLPGTGTDRQVTEFLNRGIAPPLPMEQRAQEQLADTSQNAYGAGIPGRIVQALDTIGNVTRGIVQDAYEFGESTFEETGGGVPQLFGPNAQRTRPQGSNVERALLGQEQFSFMNPQQLTDQESLNLNIRETAVPFVRIIENRPETREGLSTGIRPIIENVTGVNFGNVNINIPGLGTFVGFLLDGVTEVPGETAIGATLDAGRQAARRGVQSVRLTPPGRTPPRPSTPSSSVVPPVAQQLPQTPPGVTPTPAQVRTGNINPATVEQGMRAYVEPVSPFVVPDGVDLFETVVPSLPRELSPNTRGATPDVERYVSSLSTLTAQSIQNRATTATIRELTNYSAELQNFVLDGDVSTLDLGVGDFSTGTRAQRIAAQHSDLFNETIQRRRQPLFVADDAVMNLDNAGELSPAIPRLTNAGERRYVRRQAQPVDGESTAPPLTLAELRQRNIQGTDPKLFTAAPETATPPLTVVPRNLRILGGPAPVERANGFVPDWEYVLDEAGGRVLVVGRNNEVISWFEADEFTRARQNRAQMELLDAQIVERRRRNIRLVQSDNVVDFPTRGQEPVVQPEPAPVNPLTDSSSVEVPDYSGLSLEELFAEAAEVGAKYEDIPEIELPDTTPIPQDEAAQSLEPFVETSANLTIFTIADSYSSIVQPDRVGVRIADLKDELRKQGLTDAEIDAQLLEMQRNRQGVLYRDDDPQRITQRDRDSAVNVGGEQRHIFVLKPDRLPSRPAAQAADETAAAQDVVPGSQEWRRERIEANLGINENPDAFLTGADSEFRSDIRDISINAANRLGVVDNGNGTYTIEGKLYRRLPGRTLQENLEWGYIPIERYNDAVDYANKVEDINFRNESARGRIPEDYVRPPAIERIGNTVARATVDDLVPDIGTLRDARRTAFEALPIRTLKKFASEAGLTRYGRNTVTELAERLAETDFQIPAGTKTAARRPGTRLYVGTKATETQGDWVDGAVTGKVLSNDGLGTRFTTSRAEAIVEAMAAPSDNSLRGLPTEDVGVVIESRVEFTNPYEVDNPVPDQLLDAVQDSIMDAFVNSPEVATRFVSSITPSTTLPQLFEAFDNAVRLSGRNVSTEGFAFRRAVDEALTDLGYDAKIAANGDIITLPNTKVQLGTKRQVGIGTPLEQSAAAAKQAQDTTRFNVFESADSSRKFLEQTLDVLKGADSAQRRAMYQSIRELLDNQENLRKLVGEQNRSAIDSLVAQAQRLDDELRHSFDSEINNFPPIC